MAPLTHDGAHTEISSLLPRRLLATTSNEAQYVELSAGSCETGAPSDQLPTSWQLEAQTMALWSMPLLVNQVLQRSINMVSVFIVGRLGTTELGAVTLATITTNMAGNTVIQGLANSLDTLAAQAYGLDKKFLVGLHTQRMICFILVCSIPIMVLWWEADALLMLVLPDQRLVELTGLHMKIMILRVPAFVFFECARRFIQVQGLFYAPIYVLLITAPFNAISMWLFVHYLDWGFIGGAIAIAITENLMAVLLFLYIWLIDGSQCWGGLSKRVFSHWGPMTRLAIPGMVMHVSEFAAYEVLTLAAVRFGTAQLAAQSVLVTLAQMTWTVSFAFSVAASIRVGNWIGAGQVQAAKISAKVAIFFGCVISAFNTVMLASLRYQIPHMFTSDAEVIENVVQALPIVTVLQTFDAMAAISHGLLRGLGLQGFGGVVNLIGYYMFAIPISFSTAFLLNWQICGLWSGITIGLSIVSIVELWWLHRSNWNDAVEEARRRNEL